MNGSSELSSTFPVSNLCPLPNDAVYNQSVSISFLKRTDGILIWFHHCCVYLLVLGKEAVKNCHNAHSFEEITQRRPKWRKEIMSLFFFPNKNKKFFLRKTSAKASRQSLPYHSVFFCRLKTGQPPCLHHLLKTPQSFCVQEC